MPARMLSSAIPWHGVPPGEEEPMVAGDSNPDPRARGRGASIYSGAGNYEFMRAPQYSGDPTSDYARTTYGQHQNFIRQYRDFENDLIGSRNSDQLVTQAKEDAGMQAEIAAGIQQRNLSRYGRQLTAVEQRESQRSQRRGTALSTAGGVTNARLAQREATTRLLSDLINIGQGVNRSALQQMGVSAENAMQRRNAYQQARAQHKSQTMGMIGSIGAMAMMFLL